MHLRLRHCALALTMAMTACGGEASPKAVTSADVGGDVSAADAPLDVAQAPANYDQPGPYRVVQLGFSATDTARGRTLHLTLWAPTEVKPAAAAPMQVEDLYPPGADHDLLAALLADAPTCTSHTASALTGVAIAAGSWPIVAFSHCSACTRVSSFSLAERLASHGIAVIAPDHTGNTLFDKKNGQFEGLTAHMLETRVADLRFALDVALDPQSAALPVPWRGRFDAKRVGVFGHSFGGLTAGRVLQDDARTLAGLALAVPMATPGLPVANVAALNKPLLWLLAREDHSIMEFGNDFIRQDFQDAQPPAWLIEVADAGHFSFSDIAGLTPDLVPGCGAGTGQVDDQPFTYIDPPLGRAIAARTVTAFFARFLQGDLAATAVLDAALPADFVMVKKK